MASTQTPAQMQAELNRLRAENVELAAKAAKAASSLRFQVSEKGGVSVYGLGKFPVTLYKEQWIRLLAMAADLLAFIKDNDSKLKTKGDKKAA